MNPPNTMNNTSDLMALLEVCSGLFKSCTGITYEAAYFQKVAEHCDAAIKLLSDGSIHRRRLPATRRAITHKFKFGIDKQSNEPHKGYVTVGFFEDDEPGEIFISMKKTGSTVSGVLDCLAIVVSMALQHGVPLKTITSKLTHVRFEPDGFSGKEFGFAKSIVDYIFRWLEARYVVPDVRPGEEAEVHDPLDDIPSVACGGCGRIFVGQTIQDAKLRAIVCNHLPVQAFYQGETKQ